LLPGDQVLGDQDRSRTRRLGAEARDLEAELRDRGLSLERQRRKAFRDGWLPGGKAGLGRDGLSRDGPAAGEQDAHEPWHGKRLIHEAPIIAG
jgi:hypothetical protein